MILFLIACTSHPIPASDRMELVGECSPTPDWSGGFTGWPQFLEGGTLEGEGKLELDLASVAGQVSGTMVLSGDVILDGVAIEEGRGWQFEVDGSSCWYEGEEFTIRLESAVVDAPAGWMEAERDNPSVDGWFPDGDGYEYVDLWQGPDVDPLFGGIG